MKKVAFHNLGCKVNSYELDIMRQILADDGYEEVPFQDNADIYVVNTCTVTNIADRKSRQMLHRAKKQNPDAIVIAVGCYVETDPARVEKDDAVDLVIGNNKKSEIGTILSSYLASREEKEGTEHSGLFSQGIIVGQNPQEKAAKHLQEETAGANPQEKAAKHLQEETAGANPQEKAAEHLQEETAGANPQEKAGADDSSGEAAAKQTPAAGPVRENPRSPSNAERRKSAKPVFREDLTCSPEFEDMRLTNPGHTRAYIKIQDGCNQFCSYCIIPFARGRIRSRAQSEILAEVEGLVKKGIHEIVLTGIHVSSYGLDRGVEGPVRFDPARAGEALLELFTELNAIEGLERIRLSSLEPRIMTEKFIAGISSLKKICPHFHLSLQSGCDETLRRMNRHYTTAEYARSVELLRQYYDRPAITTDVIVGFPGETEEEFEQTCAFLEQIRFYEIHVFRYSKRNGTVAAKMKNQIPEPVKAERSDRLLAMTAAQAKEYRAQFRGEEETLLLEEICEYKGKRYWTGSTMRYVTGAVPAADADPEGLRTEESQAEGLQAKGLRTEKSQEEGLQAKGLRTEESQAEGLQAKGLRTEELQAEGLRAKGLRTEGSQAEGLRAKGLRTEESQAEGLRAKGLRTEGSQAEGLQTEELQEKETGKQVYYPGMLLKGTFTKETIPFSRGPAVLFVPR